MKFFARNKKGDLSISVNAIVILIIAVVALGLILMFMRGMFSKVSGKVETAIGLGELENPPSVDNPLTLTPSEMSLRVAGDSETLVLNFMGTSINMPFCKLNVSQFPLRGPIEANISATFNPTCYTYTKNQVNQYKIPISSPGAGASFTATKQYIETFTMVCYSTKALCLNPLSTTPKTEKSKEIVITVTP